MWKGNYSLLFSLKGLEILHQEIRGQENTSATLSSISPDLLKSRIQINQSINELKINFENCFLDIWGCFVDKWRSK
jgi:hypothetical protein